MVSPRLISFGLVSLCLVWFRFVSFGLVSFDFVLFGFVSCRKLQEDAVVYLNEISIEEHTIPYNRLSR